METPAEKSALEDLSTRILEFIQSSKELAAQSAEQVIKCERMLTEADNAIQTARRTLAKAYGNEMRLEIKQNLDKLLAVRAEIKENLRTSRASLQQARQNLRNTRDPASILRWLQSPEEDKKE